MRYYLDPREGEIQYPQEPIYNFFIDQLPSGKVNYKFASGTSEIHPNQNLIAGCQYNFILRYRPESYKLTQGDIIAFSIPRTWTQPQVIEKGAGFTEGKDLHGLPLSISLTQNTHLQWWIKIHIETEVAEQEWVQVFYNNVTIQRFPQKLFNDWRNAMRTVIDLNGNGDYACVPADKSLKPDIISAPPAKFNVVTPAIIKSNSSIPIRISTLDYCDNRASPPPTGEVFAAEPSNPFVPLKTVEMKSEHNGVMNFELPAPSNGRIHRIIVSNKKDNLRGANCPVVVSDDSEYNVFFGDIHAKTKLSDGLNSPEDYFIHARDVALLDFAAIADHNDAETSNIEDHFGLQMPDDDFRLIQNACEQFNEPSRFVTLQGFEQNQIDGYPGHRNIYFRGVCPGLFRGRTVDELYAYLEGHDALVIPHHTIIWNTKVHLDNSKYDRIVEMYSMHCSSEKRNSPINNTPNYPDKEENGVTAQEILKAGHRVGFIASSDNHNGAPGLSARPSRFTNIPYSGGLAAVFASDLSRESIFDGLWHRRCYATTGVRIYLEFRLNGELMGAETTAATGEKLPWEIKISAPQRIAKVELITQEKSKRIWRYDGSDYVELKGNLHFFQTGWVYTRVTLEDRHMAWSSPIWVDVID